jgi:crossover junction endodeoxyribonuclease RuvC
MRILAFDPGYDRLGVAVVEKKTGERESLAYSSCFTTSAKDSFEERLRQIGLETERLLLAFGPGALALERLYFTNNQKTAMHVAEVRGVLTYLAARGGIPLFEYTPQQIKVAVTGSGASSKTQVEKMIPMLVRLEKVPRFDDEYDAIAVALCCAASERETRLP